MISIPFVDLAKQYETLKPEILAAIDEVFRAGIFIQGSSVESFEKAFSQRLSAVHGIGCANGTAAVSLVLEALGIGRGDEVITVSHTFIATAEAICHVGATPVFVDIDPGNYCIDPHSFEAAITPRTRAVIVVHLYGTPCDMDPILKIARERGIRVIEDSAQAHLATYRGRCVGTLGDCGTFSFYPSKNLGAYGDAGFITCGSADTAVLLRKLRDHGRTSKYEHQIIGYNQRMDALQAAMLSVKLHHLDRWTEARRRLATRYDAQLRPAGFKTIEPTDGSAPVYHLYVFETSNRADVIETLARAGVETGIHYPLPVHLQPAFAGADAPASLPVTERVAGRVLSLPIYPELPDQAINRICEIVLQHARC